MKFKSDINFRDKNVVIMLLILISVLIACLVCFVFLFNSRVSRNSFVRDMLAIAERNETPVFRIDRIMVYSSAHAIDNSEDRNLQNVSIDQFTDIAVFIDNTSYITELTPANTIQELWIDNVEISKNTEIGESIFNYKNIQDFARYVALENAEETIYFNVVHTNEENEAADYSYPTFFTDSTNPISLGFINRNIVTNFQVEQNSQSISFNGQLLQDAEVNLEDISYTISFTINIKNNQNEVFVRSVNLEINLNAQDGEILNGFLFRGRTVPEGRYNFFRTR